MGQSESDDHSRKCQRSAGPSNMELDGSESDGCARQCHRVSCRRCRDLGRSRAGRSTGKRHRFARSCCIDVDGSESGSRPRQCRRKSSSLRIDLGQSRSSVHGGRPDGRASVSRAHVGQSGSIGRPGARHGVSCSRGSRLAKPRSNLPSSFGRHHWGRRRLSVAPAAEEGRSATTPTDCQAHGGGLQMGCAAGNSHSGRSSCAAGRRTPGVRRSAGSSNDRPGSYGSAPLSPV